MKLFLFLILFIFTNKCEAQFHFESCKDANEKAIQKAIAGELSSSNKDLFEHISIWDEGFQEYLELYFFSKYGIEIITDGCMERDYEECYQNCMDSIIISKFGSGFFKNESIKLKSNFDAISIEDRIKVIDFSKIYTFNLESYPKFIGNDKIVEKYLNTEIIKLEDSMFSWTKVIIEKNGKVVDLILREGLQMKPFSNKKGIIKKLNQIGKWEPGYVYGHRVKSELGFYIY